MILSIYCTPLRISEESVRQWRSESTDRNTTQLLFPLTLPDEARFHESGVQPPPREASVITRPLTMSYSVITSSFTTISFPYRPRRPSLPRNPRESDNSNFYDWCNEPMAAIKKDKRGDRVNCCDCTAKRYLYFRVRVRSFDPRPMKAVVTSGRRWVRI